MWPLHLAGFLKNSVYETNSHIKGIHFCYDVRLNRRGLTSRRMTGMQKVDLADGLELAPGVGATHFQRRVIVEDVIAQILQGRLRVCCGKLSCVLDLLSNLNINLLQTSVAV